MAKTTDPKLQLQVIYSIFVRNHTAEGTFRAVIPDLPRIRALGADIIWLLPIHPIGEKNRKGTLGSPYSISDYRAVNPELGTLEDLKALVEAIHDNGMKCIIDVVYNHTSPDAVYTRTHPEFYFRKPDGSFGNRVGDWSDIIDLDYNVPGLWDAQCEALCYWADIVDGFRCDVASFVPAAFWTRARQTIEAKHPDFIWLAESCSPSFAFAHEKAGIRASRDIDLYEAFDMEYDYDIREAYEQYLCGETTIGHYLSMTNLQEFMYPDNYNKARFLENHDTQRIAAQVESVSDLRNHMAMMYFLKGATLLYAGQEFGMTHRTSLFEKDTIDRTGGMDFSEDYARLGQIKRDWLDPDDRCYASWDNSKSIAVIRRSNAKREKIGVFALTSRYGVVQSDFPDGLYINAVDGKTVRVKNGKLTCEGSPIILSTDHPANAGQPEKSTEPETAKHR